MSVLILVAAPVVIAVVPFFPPLTVAVLFRVSVVPTPVLVLVSTALVLLPSLPAVVSALLPVVGLPAVGPMLSVVVSIPRGPRPVPGVAVQVIRSLVVVFGRGCRWRV